MVSASDMLRAALVTLADGRSGWDSGFRRRDAIVAFDAGTAGSRVLRCAPRSSLSSRVVVRAAAARPRGRRADALASPDHVLLAGPSGTRQDDVNAAEMGTSLDRTSALGPARW